jgi:5,10-methylenetetrahydrofolate reductase
LIVVISGKNTNSVSLKTKFEGISTTSNQVPTGGAGETGRPLICLEINPPHGSDLEDVIERYSGQVEHLDFLNVTDSALARMKMAPLPFASLLKNRLGIEPLVNISCRDRNIMALQSDLLAGWALGVRGVVALTGDAMSVGDCPQLKGVFEINSVGLLSLIQKLNAGVDFSDKPLKGHPDFAAGVVLNPNAKNPGVELRRLEKKVAAGAKFALTQPVFDAASSRDFFKSASGMGVPIMVGLLPFKTAQAALSVIGQVPGIKIPDSLIKIVTEDPERDWSTFFIDRSIELSLELKSIVAGFHIVSGTTPKLALKLSQQLATALG